jgi:hypothetical protein
MSPDRYMNPSCLALAGALALAATSALANPLASPTSIPQDAIQLAAADSNPTVADASGSATTRDYPAIQAGVRRAAAEGPEALRRYCFRTRMIYNFYFWNFVNQEGST